MHILCSRVKLFITKKIKIIILNKKNESYVQLPKTMIVVGSSWKFKHRPSIVYLRLNHYLESTYTYKYQTHVLNYTPNLLFTSTHSHTVCTRHTCTLATYKVIHLHSLYWKQYFYIIWCH